MNACKDAAFSLEQLAARRPGSCRLKHPAEEHRLADCTRVRIRPIAPHDLRMHWRFLCSLSLQTRYQRLLSPRALLPGELRRLVDIDYEREMALVAVAEIDGDEQELGVARYVREPAGGATGRLADVAEFAIVVADAWQQRGVGRVLLQRLHHVAMDAGVRQLAGLTLATNTRMIRLARRLGFEISREHDDWTVKRVTWRQADSGEDTALSASREPRDDPAAGAGTRARSIRAQ